MKRYEQNLQIVQYRDPEMLQSNGTTPNYHLATEVLWPSPQHRHHIVFNPIHLFITNTSYNLLIPSNLTTCFVSFPSNSASAYHSISHVRVVRFSIEALVQQRSQRLQITNEIKGSW